MTDHLTLTRRLRTEDVDLTGRLTVPGLMSLFQELATLHSRELGVDYYTLREKSNAYWVIARLRLCFLGEALFGEEVVAKTWPLKPSSLTFDREMSVSSPEGTPLAAFTSEWCVLDWDTHRLRRAESTCFPTDAVFREEKAGAGELMRLGRSTAGMALCFTHTVRYSDLDMNRHTNNTVYARLAVDTFSAAELEARPIRWLEIHFLRESHEGDELCLWRCEEPQGIRVLGTKGTDGEAVFVASLGFSE